MRNIFTLLLISSSIVVSVAQNQGLTQSTQFPVNSYLLNPAYAGAEEYTSFQASYKKNWAGASVGPQTIYLSGHTRIQSEGKIDVKREIKKDTIDKTNFSLPTRGRSADKYKKRLSAKQDSLKIQQMQYELDYQKRVAEAKEQLKYRPYHGFGGHVINEQTGATTRTGVNAAYAYHFWLGKKLRWSLGASLGLGSFSFGTLDAPDKTDQTLLNNSGTTSFSPDLTVGTYLYHDKFYIGVSAFSLVSTSVVKGSNDPTSKLTPVLVITGGYKISINENTFITPGIIFRYPLGVLPFSYGVNARINYKTVWGGVSYTNDAVSGMIGINLAKVFDISYSYDFTTSAFQNFTRVGGHEIVLGYRLQRRNGSLTSRLFN